MTQNIVNKIKSAVVTTGATVGLGVLGLSQMGCLPAAPAQAQAQPTIADCERCCRMHADESNCQDDGCRSGHRNHLREVCLPRCQTDTTSCR